MLRGARGRRRGVLLREATMLPKFGVSAGEHTRAIFDAIDIATMSDSEVLESRLVAAPGLRIAQQYATYDGRRFDVPAATVSREPGLGVSTLIDPDTVPVLLSLRPDHALADAVSEVEAGAGGDAETLPRILRTFRELIALGLVLRTTAGRQKRDGHRDAPLALRERRSADGDP